MSNNTEGKVVIAGESIGLGEALARLLYAQGASVLLGRGLLYVLTKLQNLTLISSPYSITTGFDRTPWRPRLFESRAEAECSSVNERSRVD